jgi:protein disulfide-isomerase
MRLEREVFTQPALGQKLATNYVPVKLNFDRNTAIARRYGVESLPTDVVIRPDGGVVDLSNSPATAIAYLAKLNQVAARAGRTGMKVLAGQTAPLHATGPPTAGLVGSAQGAAGTTPRRYSDDRYAEYFNRRQTSPAEISPSYAQPAGAWDGARATSQRYAAAERVSSDRYAAPAGVVSNVSVPPARSMPTGAATLGSGQQRSMPPAAVTRGPGAASAQTSWQADYHQQQALPHAGAFAPSPRVNPASNASASIGLDGRCPVTLVERHQWLAGDPRFGAVHRGRTYLFAGQQEQQLFLVAPDRYSPAIAGNDSVAASEQGLVIPGRREHGVFFGNRIYLFANEANLEKFEREPDHYAAIAQSVMR